MKPEVWGKHLWYSIHFIALGYPDVPTAADKQNYFAFYESLKHVLPCPACAQHYAVHFQNLPIDSSLATKNKLFAWTVELHNLVNRDLGKEQWSVDRAYTHYLAMAQSMISAKDSGCTKREGRMYTFLVIFNVTFLVLLALYMYSRSRKITVK
jgi:hypothetical protein